MSQDNGLMISRQKATDSEVNAARAAGMGDKTVEIERNAELSRQDATLGNHGADAFETEIARLTTQLKHAEEDASQYKQTVPSEIQNRIDGLKRSLAWQKDRQLAAEVTKLESATIEGSREGANLPGAIPSGAPRESLEGKWAEESYKTAYEHEVRTTAKTKGISLDLATQIVNSRIQIEGAERVLPQYAKVVAGIKRARANRAARQSD